jgi:transposase
MVDRGEAGDRLGKPAAGHDADPGGAQTRDQQRTIIYWRQQLLHGFVDPKRRSAPTFAQVEIAAAPPELALPDRAAIEPVGTVAATRRRRSEGLIEIVLPQGVRLRVDAQVDEHALRRVLGALEGR